jgi:Mg2+ and Co2+ transporter CorA
MNGYVDIFVSDRGETMVEDMFEYRKKERILQNRVRCVFLFFNLIVVSSAYEVESMSEVKHKCELTDCNRGASTRCYCCDKSICTRHFTEHIEAVRAQVDPLENEINAMADKIRDLTIEKFTEGPLEKLYQWKNDMHQLIDEIFVTKSKEIEEVVERNNIKFTEYKKQQLETVMKIQEDIKQLAEDGDATFEQIKTLRNRLTSIEINLVAFQNSFLSIDAQVFGEGIVTVSSTLNNPLTIPNIQPSTTLQSSSKVFFLSTIFTKTIHYI